MKLTKDMFTERANKTHNFLYDYSLVKYKNSHTKIKIECNRCLKIWEQKPVDHLNGFGCRECNSKERLFHLSKKNSDLFIKKAKQIHNCVYDYSLVKYKNNRTKIVIICKKHGEFLQTPDDHTNSEAGCPKCFGAIKRTLEQFLHEANEIHNSEYDYSKFAYINSATKGIVICKKHGEFTPTPHNHVNFKTGCPKCNNCKSKGEDKIRFLLQQNNILFEEQKRFENCKNIRCLPFDFYLPKQNVLIEYDGSQHFIQVKNREKLEIIQKRDSIKNDFAINCNIQLLRISYKDNVEQKLKAYFLFEKQ